MKMKTDYQIAQQNLDRLSQKSSLSYSISSSGFKKILTFSSSFIFTGSMF